MQHVEDLGDKFLVSIERNKNDYSGQFIIGTLFYDKVQKYMSLRPSVGLTSDRFFIKYKNGKCAQQNIGIHSIGKVPSQIASYLGLPTPERYTGHCFRRTSATLLSESGATMQMIKQAGRWRSDLIAQGYIENSLNNRQMIFDGIIQRPMNPSVIHVASKSTNPSSINAASKSTNPNIYNKPSTSTKVPEVSLNLQKKVAETTDDSHDVQIFWSDFCEDFDTTEDFATKNVEPMVCSTSSK